MKRRAKLLTPLAILIIVLTGCVTDQSALKEADAYFKEGLSYLNNDPQRAFVSFQKAIQLDPKNRDAHYALGHIYFMQGRTDKAGDEFRRVLKINPVDSEAHNYLGKVYEREGRWDDAIYEYREALKNPLYATPDVPHYNLGIALMNKGEPEGALKDLGEAVSINPNHILAHYEMGQIYLKMGRLKEAIGAYQTALRIFPDYPEAHFNLAIAYKKDGANALAKKEFETVIKLAPGSEIASDSSRYLDGTKE